MPNVSFYLLINAIQLPWNKIDGSVITVYYLTSFKYHLNAVGPLCCAKCFKYLKMQNGRDMNENEKIRNMAGFQSHCQCKK